MLKRRYFSSYPCRYFRCDYEKVYLPSTNYLSLNWRHRPIFGTAYCAKKVILSTTARHVYQLGSFGARDCADCSWYVSKY